jgi:diadenosine tetraphosphate (Ap4A) HIT family hydrolase/5-methylcytosine-specific restriction endonuclease McrA
MRMSHIYQPVMLMELLRSGGRASINDIARALLSHDQSQIDYYEKITRDMVGRVLGNHRIVSKEGRSFKLNDYELLMPEQREELIAITQMRLDEYVTKRGDLIYQHRRQSSGYIAGSLRYEVLKRAEFHCELCGISADLKALEVDHILPRSRGGGDDMENLQALCYSCNAMKRDRDDTDFRSIHANYEHRQDGCLFCEIPEDRAVMENNLSYAIRDAFPVTKFHTLVIPKRHVSDYFGLSRPELNACDDLIRKLHGAIQAEDASVAGFNIGMNSGEAAGQTVFHCHIHVIPRRRGDIENPRGGVRGVIPRKQAY